MAPGALPIDAWTQARERFVEDLDEVERLTFTNATFENVFCSASAAQKTHEAESVSRALAAKINAFLAGIDEWGKALDVYSNASAMILCPLWGSLRVLIHVCNPVQLSSEFGKYYGSLVDMLAQIGDVVPRFQIYERLFSSHLRLTQALSIAYLDVIEFCTVVKAVFKKAKRNYRTVSPFALEMPVVNVRVLLKLSWKSVDRQFSTLMTRFRAHRKAVEKEAGIANMLEVGTAQDFESKILLQLEKQRNEEDRIKTLSMLSSIQWTIPYQRALRSRHENTGLWIFDTDVFKKWKNSTSSGCLYCYGIPGSGKTVLTAGVVEALAQEVGNDSSGIAYFFCEYDEDNTLDPLAIIGTIIQQLLILQRRIPEPIATAIRDLYGHGIRKPTTEKLIALLCSVMEQYTYVYVVIDAVDEAGPDTQDEILNLVKVLTSVDTTAAKVFFSSRESSSISEALRTWPRVNVSEGRTAKDVDAYIRASITKRLTGLEIMQNIPTLQAEAEHELMAKAKGMFLWVFFQIEELSDPSHSKESFKATLHSLPEGLTETYRRIALKIANKPKRQISLANRVFKWTLNARRHLTLPELQEAVAIEPGDQSWERSKIPMESDGKRFLRHCGALVLFDETDHTVRLVHHTVAQFLREHTFRNEETNDLLADVCLTYLNFDDFETQIVLAGKERHVFRWNSPGQSPFSRIIQLLGISRGIYDFLLNLCSRGARGLSPDVDYVELLKNIQKQSSSVPFEEKYQLLGYIRQYWIWHMLHIEENDTERRDSFRDLVFVKNLLFDFRPWGTSQGPAGLPHLTVFLWALDAGHESLLHLLQEFAPLQKYLKYSTTPQLEQLITEGRIGIIELLVRSKPLIAANHSLMQRALLSRRFDTLRLLLDSARTVDKTLVAKFVNGRYKSLSDSLDLDGHVLCSTCDRRPLHLAACDGNIKLSRLLLEHGAEIDGQDSYRQTPLFYACKSYKMLTHHDQIDTIHFLLDKGADVKARDIDGETALQSAIRKGLERESVAELLLSKGAGPCNINFKQESIFETALLYAPYTILRLLRRYGVNMETKDSLGMTPLVRALRPGGAAQESEARASKLIASGADVNAKGESGLSALHLAVWNRRSIAVLESLLDAGARMDVRDTYGRLPLDLAIGSPETIKTLIKYGMDLNLTDSKWEPALIHPIRHGYKATVETLLAGGMNPNTMDHGSPRKPALTCAVIFGQVEIAGLLVRYGAKVQPFELDQLADPFYWAITQGNVRMLNFLFKHLKRDDMYRMGYVWGFVGLKSEYSRSDHLDDLDEDMSKKQEFKTGQLIAKELRKLAVPHRPTGFDTSWFEG